MIIHSRTHLLKDSSDVRTTFSITALEDCRLRRVWFSCDVVRVYSLILMQGPPLILPEDGDDPDGLDSSVLPNTLFDREWTAGGHLTSVASNASLMYLRVQMIAEVYPL